MFNLTKVMYRNVSLGHIVHGGRLERILTEAAQDVGLTAISRDYHKKEYEIRDDGTASEEEVYRETTISLRRGIFPMIEISPFDKKISISKLGINTGFVAMFTPNEPLYKICFGSRKLVERYLTAVSQRLQRAETKDVERLSA